ncbi:subtilisin-like serine protease QhpE [Paracoccus tegillarcae]|uniref:Subtilisin n=1 Tax=Paracoccus tegillarcae TaxID=1529068 RepID=A0A2K9ETN8_9RHOB|nr:subtilisin [Paracoccus tegillarcae]AUH34206.1 subtilisin [Paracoccus tegillarcae]
MAVVRRLTVGIVDSGGPPDTMADARAFFAEGCGPAMPDRLGHGTAVGAIIRRAAPDARLHHAQVFDDRPITSADRVARAIDWLSADCAVIVLSLGLASDRRVLRQACKAALARGCSLVAASPSRGGPCWPAAYPGVIAATGDARCGWPDLSLLPDGVIGAWCASPEHGGTGMGGASLAAARVAGHLAAGFAEAGSDPFQWLAKHARHIGPERRLAAVPAR